VWITNNYNFHHNVQDHSTLLQEWVILTVLIKPAQHSIQVRLLAVFTVVVMHEVMQSRSVLYYSVDECSL